MSHTKLRAPKLIAQFYGDFCGDSKNSVKFDFMVHERADGIRFIQMYVTARKDGINSWPDSYGPLYHDSPTDATPIILGEDNHKAWNRARQFAWKPEAQPKREPQPENPDESSYEKELKSRYPMHIVESPSRLVCPICNLNNPCPNHTEWEQSL